MAEKFFVCSLNERILYFTAGVWFFHKLLPEFLQIHVIIAKICTCLNGSGIEIDSTQKCIEPKKNHFEPDLLHLSKKQSSRTSNYALGSHHVPGIRKSDIY